MAKDGRPGIPAGRAERSDGPDARSWSAADLVFWIDCIGTPIVVVDRDRLVVERLNRTARAYFGLPGDHPLPCPIGDLVGAEAADTLGRIWSVAPSGVAGDAFIVRCVVGGREQSMLFRVATVVVDGRAVRLFTLSETPSVGSASLASWQANMMKLLNWLPFGLEFADLDDQVQFVNAHFHTLFGYEQHELADVENWWRLAYPDPDYRDYARRTWARAVAEARAGNREMTPFELVVTTKDGSQKIIQFRHRTFGDVNVNLYIDMTMERAHSSELKKLADTDPLTGIMNRRRFFEEATAMFRSTDPSSGDLALLLLDLDHFKRINDRYGHTIGDLALQEFTLRCRASIREHDLLARLGGEEFVMLMPGTSDREAREIGERIRKATADTPFALGDRAIAATVSIGGALRTVGDASLDMLLDRADAALYDAKHRGRNRFVMGA